METSCCIAWGRFLEVPSAPLALASINDIPPAPADVAGRFLHVETMSHLKPVILAKYDHRIVDTVAGLILHATPEGGSPRCLSMTAEKPAGHP